MFTVIIYSLLFIKKCYGFYSGLNSINAAPGEFPAALSIVGENGETRCSATILDSMHALTAAHCIPDDQKNVTWYVQYGLIERSSKKQRIKIDHQIKHEDYQKEGRNAHDIGVLFLKKPIPISLIAQPVLLPKGNDPIEFNTPAIQVGLGGVRNSTKAMILQRRILRIATTQECKHYYSEHDSTHELCTSAPVANLGTCSGDTGSVLYSGGRLIGIEQLGIGCNQPISLHTKVSFYIDWIWKTIDDYNSKFIPTLRDNIKKRLRRAAGNHAKQNYAQSYEENNPILVPVLKKTIKIRGKRASGNRAKQQGYRTDKQIFNVYYYTTAAINNYFED